MRILILGGGLAGISLAYFLQNNPKFDEITILEKEERVGGLCRSFETHGIYYDIGPHIIFSKDTEILKLMESLLDDNLNKLRRSNQIIYANRFIQYPFENDLSKLPKEDLDYCLNGFVKNPYEYLPIQNMLQFFLKTFGEGITNSYLRPYNEKIWKFDPSFLDTQMVERIPKPTQEDIMRSAKGETIDGYLHQLYFSYPKSGGIESIINSFVKKFTSKIKIITNFDISLVKKEENAFFVSNEKNQYNAEKLVSTIPTNLLVDFYIHTPNAIVEKAHGLRYNSILIVIIGIKSKDKAGNNFVFTLPDKDIIFHRLTKVDFLGEEYRIPNIITYMGEITYRNGDLINEMKNEYVINKVVEGMQKIQFIDSKDDIAFSLIKKFEYAYVVYAINHRNNMDVIKEYFQMQGIYLNGRFGEFEYFNMDTIIRRSKNLAEKIERER